MLPEHAGFGESGNPSSAAVFIKYQDTASLDEVGAADPAARGQQHPGLTYDKVSVELVPSAPQGVSAAVPAGQLDSVWSIQVASDSAGLLRLILGGLTAGMLAACAGLGFLFFKMRTRGESRG